MNRQKNNHGSSFSLGLLFGLIAFSLFLGLIYHEDILNQFQAKLAPNDYQPRGILQENTYTIRRPRKLNRKSRERQQELSLPSTEEHGAIATYLDRQIEALHEQLREAKMNEKRLSEDHFRQIAKMENHIDAKSQELAEKINIIEELKLQIAANHNKQTYLEGDIQQLNAKLDEEKRRLESTKKSKRNLTDNIQEFAKQIEQSNQIIQEEHKKSIELAKSLTQKENELLKLTDQVNHLTAQTSQHDDHVVQFEKEKLLTQKQLEKKSQALVKAQQNIDQKSQELAQKIELIDDLKHQLVAKNEQSSLYKERIQSLKQELEIERSGRQDTEVAQTDQQAKIDELMQQVLDANRLVLDAQLKNKETAQHLEQKNLELLELTQLTGQNGNTLGEEKIYSFANYKQLVQEVEKEKSIQHRQLMEKQLELDLLRQQVNLKSETLAKKTDLIQDMKLKEVAHDKQRSFYEKHIQNLNQQIAAETKKLHNFETLQTDYEARIDELSQQVNHANQWVQELQEQNEEIAFNLKQKDDELSESSNEMNHLKAQIASAENELARAKEAHETKIAKIHEHFNEIQADNIRLNEELKEQLFVSNDYNSSLNEHITQLNHQLDEARERVQDFEKLHAALQAKNHELNQEIQVANQLVQETQNQAKGATDHLQQREDDLLALQSKVAKLETINHTIQEANHLEIVQLQEHIKQLEEKSQDIASANKQIEQLSH